MERHKATIRGAFFQRKDSWEAVDMAFTLDDGRRLNHRYFGTVERVRGELNDFCKAIGCDNPQAGTLSMYASLLTDRIKKFDGKIEIDVVQRKYIDKKGEDAYVPDVGPAPCYHATYQKEGVMVDDDSLPDDFEPPIPREPLFADAGMGEAPKPSFPKGAPNDDFEFDLPF